MKIGTLIYSYFLTSIIVNNTVLGFLPVDYFNELSFFYGLLGNAIYSLIEIMRMVSHLAENEKAKQFNRWMWILLGIRPIVAGLLSFIVTPIIRVSASSMPAVASIVQTKEADIMIGLMVGLLFEYIMKKAFFDKIADKILKTN